MDDNDHCTACGYDLGTHHPSCSAAYPNWQDTRESLASLLMRSDEGFWTRISKAREEAKGWWQYTDEAGDTWTTNSPRKIIAMADCRYCFWGDDRTLLAHNRGEHDIEAIRADF